MITIQQMQSLLTTNVMITVQQMWWLLYNKCDDYHTTNVLGLMYNTGNDY